MSLRTSVRKSSSSICLLAGIQRPSIRLVFNQAGAGAAASTSSSSSSSSASASASTSSSSTFFAASSIGEDKGSDSKLSLLLRSISGVLLGSGVGYWFCSSSSYSELPLSFADWPKETNESAVVEDQDQQHSFGLHDVLEEKRSNKFLFGDAFRRKVFFNYEKRLRLRSPPEKVFEYFASFRTPEGEVLMKPADLMRAVVPVFPPSESNLVREGCLSLERGPGDLHCAPSTFFMLFDTNNDGLISFAEYIFFVTILSIPESSFSIAFKMFDIDNNGEIDREEFKKVMALMRSRNRQGAHHRDGMRKGLKAGCSVDNGGLLEYFFGTEGNMSLQHAKFVDFLRDLHNEILRLEFAHYDFKQRGTISATDFALSMVASADMSHINKFFNRVEKLNKEPQLRDIRITWEEFKAFAELRKSLEPLTLAIFTYGKVNGLLTKKDFQRAASNVCGIALTDNVVDIIFHVFDTNSDGSLSINEFVRVIQRRERDTGQPSMEAGVMGSMSSWLRNARKFSAE